MQETLSSGKTPIIKLAPENDIEVSVTMWTDEDDVLAVSHVWAHGLGNVHTNQMPLCQLTRLRPYMTDFPGLKVDAIWIDTLCGPIDPDLRKVAIAGMRTGNAVVETPSLNGTEVFEASAMQIAESVMLTAPSVSGSII